MNFEQDRVKVDYALRLQFGFTAMNNSLPCRLIGTGLLMFGLAAGALGQPGPARGPLRILKSNPRYFTDGSGKAIYLAGSHNWGNFQDSRHRWAIGDPPPPSDYGRFLDFLQTRHHNFFRLWRWETPKWTDDEPRGVAYSKPHPWLRSGPGAANDQKPKFDLTRFDPEYFERLRTRVTAAGERGMYVSVMLFEGWAVQMLDAWTCHPFNLPNNLNGIDADADRDGRGLEFYTLQPTPMGQRVLDLQEAYVRKVIDTVNDLDNVLYEVSNEAGAYSTERALFDSPADWISPNPGEVSESYLENPPANSSGKVIVNDTDHLCGHTCGDNLWVWKSFCRGLNVLFMEELPPSPTWHDSARLAMGQTRRYAERINLAEMTPRNELASVRYCLAKPGSEYLVFQPGGRGEFSVDLKSASGAFSVEWFNINADTTVPGKPVEGGAVRVFSTPFPGPAALYRHHQRPALGAQG